MSGREITDAERAEIRRVFAITASVKKTAQITNWSQHIVKRTVNAKTERSRGEKLKERNRLIKLHAERGSSLKQLSERFQLGRGYMRKLCRELGVTPAATDRVLASEERTQEEKRSNHWAHLEPTAGPRLSADEYAARRVDLLPPINTTAAFFGDPHPDRRARDPFTPATDRSEGQSRRQNPEVAMPVFSWSQEKRAS